MALTAIEEHWNLPDLALSVKALPADRADPSIAFDEMGENKARLEDLGAGRLEFMAAQGVDLQVLSLAPPGTQPLDPADAVKNRLHR
ncbi:hypothetical protein H9638_14785 [Arthrobacter sp. Sa2BUA2]|uniref:Uncharacterized protein n=1 Tax=Arthrobacter pullicola TaxID=2762224 RepID=A0ABR8YLG5_9MICC|nr:hypothetical protein [Arthrobacter pullicola]MBD8045076.1 hypothetical protein [Arthrobacter pullicola]